MFIQTVSVVRRNFISRRGGEGGETIIKSKLARKRRTRATTMGQESSRHPRVEFQTIPGGGGCRGGTTNEEFWNSWRVSGGWVINSHVLERV